MKWPLVLGLALVCVLCGDNATAQSARPVLRRLGISKVPRPPGRTANNINSCRRQSRRHTTRIVCNIYLRCVRCPEYSCLERGFFKSKQDIRVLARKIGAKVGRKKGAGRRKFGSRTSIGCDSFLFIDGNAVEIRDDETNAVYQLATIPAGCGGPFYQPVLEGGCGKDYCCERRGRCKETKAAIPYLIVENGQLNIILVTKFVGCECVNI